MKQSERPSNEKGGAPQGEVHNNIEKLVSFAEALDEDGTLIPVFLALLEVCFQS